MSTSIFIINIVYNHYKYTALANIRTINTTVNNQLTYE